MREALAKIVRAVLHRCGADLIGHDPRHGFRGGQDEIVRAVQPYTMTGTRRVCALIEAVEYVLANDIPGAIVECGVWKGGSIMAAAKTLQLHGCDDREIYLFDTFEGMTAPDARDVSRDGEPARELFEETSTGEDSSAWCDATLDDVRRAVVSTGYPESRFHFVKGKVEDTVPESAPEGIALLRLDTDWYESTKHEMVHLFPRLAPGGVLILDDYGYWEGSREAVDEYLAETGTPLLLCRIDDAARIAVKQAN